MKTLRNAGLILLTALLSTLLAATTTFDLIVTSGINDTSGNEQLKFVKTTTAVNEFTFTNAATGNRPKLKSTGTDTNVGMTLETQGTGQILLITNAVTQMTIDPAVLTFNAANVQFNGQFQFASGGSLGAPSIYGNFSPFPQLWFAAANGGTVGFSPDNSTQMLALTGSSGLVIPKTITAAATTGAQTINKPMGQVNFAAAATTLVVTNSMVTANSIVLVQVLGTDATFTTARVTKASGSFTITANAAATAETAVSFLVIN